MADIRCLICNRVNEASADRCWYCHTILPKPTGPLTQKEREKLANLKKKIVDDSKHAPEPPAESPQETPSENSVEEEIPEWLARIRRLKHVEDKGQLDQQTDWVNEEQPDWLLKLQQPAAHEVPAATDSETRAVSHEKPALDESLQIRNLPRVTDEGQVFPADALEKISPKSAEDLTDISSDQSDLDSEDWLKDQLEQAEPSLDGLVDQDTLEIEDLAGYAQKSSDQEKTSTESEPAEPAGTGAELPFPLFIDNLPDWLSTEEPVTEQSREIELSEDAITGGIPERKIEKGRLPAWLQSLRPAATEPGDNQEGQPAPVMEDHGVLAGIAGTLPGADLSGRVMNPAASTQELRVLAHQQKNAELFQSLLQPVSERSTDTDVRKPDAPLEKLVRILVTILVLLAVIMPMLAPGISVVIPVLFPTEVVNTLGTLQSLPAEKPVLVAAHFEAGLAGELDWAAQPVLKHLVLRGVPMALTSTNVVGIAILQNLVTDAIGDNTAYVKDDKVVDLGYLPGGVIGMGALVNDPFSALPFTADLQPIRDIPVLDSVSSLSDFGALILLTDNPEFARTWVEQVDGGDATLPLLAVVSAQAAPLLQPYFASGQIDGYVSGMSGALYYEMLTMRAGSATARFGAYQLSLLVVAVLIFAGGVVSLILAAPTHAKKKEAG